MFLKSCRTSAMTLRVEARLRCYQDRRCLRILGCRAYLSNGALTWFARLVLLVDLSK